MNDAPLMKAYSELSGLVEAEHTPPWIKAACFSLSNQQSKLFSTVPDGYGAADWAKPVDDAGTLDADVFGLRLEPSKFLSELLAALRASEWPRVLVLIHGLAPLPSAA